MSRDKAISLPASFLLLLAFASTVSARAQTSTPDCTAAPYNLPAGYPTSTTTSAQDQLHMMCLQGLQFPTAASNPPLTPTRTGDPYKPVNAWPTNLTTPETSNWTDSLSHTIVRHGWGAWTLYDDADSGGTASVLCNGGANCTVAAQKGTATGGATAGVGDYGPYGPRPYPTGSALLGDGNSTICTAPGCLSGSYYPPIDMFTMKDGVTKIATAKDWWMKRRPELLDLVQKELYGYMLPPAKWPAISWVISTPVTGSQAGVVSCLTNTTNCTQGTIADGNTYAYSEKSYTGTLSMANYPASAPPLRNQPIIKMTCRFPAAATGKIPVFISIGNADTVFQYTAPLGFAACGYTQTSLQADAGGAATSSYLSGLVNGGNWRSPTDPGTLELWAWGISRMIDEFAVDPDPNGPDPDKVAVEGHSRNGKATLVAAALDDRIVASMPSGGGAAGTSFVRRHYGESVESIVGSGEYYWVAGYMLNYAGPACQTNPSVGPAGCTPSYFPRKVRDLDVDSPQVMALIAPRAVMTNGGTAGAFPGNGDEWQDPRGMYLSGAMSSPVWNLLGWPGQVIPAGTVFTSNPTPYHSGESIGGTPPFDTAFISGTVGYRRHVQGHTDVPEWPVFVTFASKYLNDLRPVITPGQSFQLAATSNTIGTVKGTNGGGGAMTNWQIKGGTGALLFDIGATTGAITILDRSKIANTSYTLVLMASDGILPAHDTTVTISPSVAIGSADITKTAISTASSTYTPGNAQTLSATVTDTVDSTKSPTGSVVFTDFTASGATAIGTGTVTNGVAVTSYAPASTGAHTLTASFQSSDTTKFASSSDAVGINVSVIPDFTWAVQSPQVVSVNRGGTATFTFMLAPGSGGSFPGAVTFYATNAPSGATVTFSPSTVAANAGSQTITVTLKMPANSAHLGPAPGVSDTGSGVALAALGFTGLLLWPRRRRLARAILSLCFMAAIFSAVIGCSNETIGYPVQFVASSAGTQHSVPVSVQVH